MRTHICVIVALLLSVSCDKGPNQSLDESGRMSIVENDDKEPLAMIMLTLADGTKCSLPSSQEKARVKFVDKEKKTYHATFEGPLKCGEKRINLKGYVNKKP